MNSKLYVGNLPYSATENDLRQLFCQAGIITSIDLIRDRESHRSKGYAFVEMSSAAEAEQAVSMFNGFTLGDRQLRVNMAQLREERRVNPDTASGHHHHLPQRGDKKRY